MLPHHPEEMPEGRDVASDSGECRLGPNESEIGHVDMGFAKSGNAHTSE
jgi:hypothetical protein